VDVRAPVLQLAFLFGIAPVGFGSTDISGKWGVRAQTTSGPAATVGCLVEMSKSGMALSVAGSCQLIGAVTLAGTIDATAGTFTASGHSDLLVQFSISTGVASSTARTCLGQSRSASADASR